MGQPVSTPARTARFGAFDIDLRSGELRKSGIRIKLQDQPFRLLAVLLERPGELVTRAELKDRIWPDIEFGDFDHSVSLAVNKLRTALSDSADNPRFVQTLHRRGYRFIAPVQIISGSDADAPPEIAKTVLAMPPIRHRRFVPLLFAVAVLLTLGAFATFTYWHRATIPSVAVLLHKRQIQSVAVLPMANLSRDPEQESFADGMTDAVIAELARLGSLRVISRQSVMRFKGSSAPLKQIASELNVDAVVEGTVLRSGDRVRVTANLVQAATDSHLWAQQYDRDVRDVLSLQSDIARAIAEEVKVSLTPEQKRALAKSRPTVDPQAYELYLRGYREWYKLTEESLRKSAAYFQQSLGMDPQYAPAHAGLAASYAVLGQQELLPPSEAYARSRQAVTKALEIDDSLGEAHAILGWIHRNYDWDWRGAEQEFRLALRLSPGSAQVHHGYAAYLSVVGREDEALHEQQKALELDPLSSFYAGQLGLALAERGDYDKATELFRKALELDPNNLRAHYGLGEIYVARGDYEHAITELRTASELPRGRLDVVARLAEIYVRVGRRPQAEKLLAQVKALAAQRHVSPLDLASLYAVLGKKEDAFRELDRAYRERSPFLVQIRSRRTLENIRSDPRFADMVHRIGLPQKKPADQ